MSTATALQPERHHEVRVHIDQKLYHTLNPTTGAALYKLASIPPDLALYREVLGDREDYPIDNDPDAIHLREDEHFHSAPMKHHEVAIIVNGQQKHVTIRRLTFSELVALAFNPIPTGPNILFTITYENGPHANPHGELLTGGSLKIRGGMIFNVSCTDRS